MDSEVPEEPLERFEAGARRPSAPEEGEDGFIRFRRSHFYAALLPIAFVTGLAFGYLAWGRTPDEQPSTALQQPAQAQETTRIEVSSDDDPALGPSDAAVTIVAFSDYNCPYCTRFHVQTFSPLLDRYGDDIRFVYRDYPITSQESFRAAQAAECADDQGAFWEYHDALFVGDLGLNPDAYRQYAEQLDLDVEELMDCIEDERFADEVQQDARYAAGLGVTGTPTFFINGIPLAGAQPLTRFTQVIDSELN